jgi:hypothetical protein
MSKQGDVRSPRRNATAQDLVRQMGEVSPGSSKNGEQNIGSNHNASVASNASNASTDGNNVNETNAKEGASPTAGSSDRPAQAQSGEGSGTAGGDANGPAAAAPAALMSSALVSSPGGSASGTGNPSGGAAGVGNEGLTAEAKDDDIYGEVR